MESAEKEEDLSNSNELEAISKALGIPAVVKLILEYVCRSDLLQFRLVDTLWRDLASDILHHRFTACAYRPLNLAYDEKTKNYKLYILNSKPKRPEEEDEDDDELEKCHQGRGGDKKQKNNKNNNTNGRKDKAENKNEKDLTALTKLIKTSDRFPCYSFVFFGGNLYNKHVQEFLNTHGKQIRVLYLIKMSVLTEDDEERCAQEARRFTELLLRPLLHFCGHFNGHRHDGGGDDDESDEDSDDGASLGGVWSCDMSLLRNLLYSQVPNLENFSVDPNGDLPQQSKLFTDESNDDDDNDEKKTPGQAKKGQQQQKVQKLMLPRLQNIALINNIPPFWTEILKEIIMVAPNLQGLHDTIKLDGLSWFASVNRLHLVRNVRLLIHPTQKHVDGLKEVADFKLKLKKLELYDVSLLSLFPCDKAALVVKYLEQILESSKDTLETLSVNRPTSLHIIPGAFKWPEGGLKQLKLLRLANYSKTEQQGKENLEYDLNLSTIFPTLTTVIIEGKSGNILSSTMNQSTKNVLDTVTRLDIINGSQTTEFMEEMIQIFPNIRILTMTNITRLSSFGSSLWKFKELTTLAMKMGVDGRSMQDRKQNTGANTNHFPNLDVIFTGFTQETVEQLDKELDINLMDKTQLDELRVNPSIVDCKRLRKLDIQFDDVVDNYCHHRLNSPPTFNLLSKVTGFCAFNLMPNLNVTLSIKKNRFVAGNSSANDWNDENSRDHDDSAHEEDLLDEQMSAESDFEYDPIDLDVEAAHKFSHGICRKNLNEALAPMVGFPNVHVVSVDEHDISIFPDE